MYSKYLQTAVSANRATNQVSYQPSLRNGEKETTIDNPTYDPPVLNSVDPPFRPSAFDSTNQLLNPPNHCYDTHGDHAAADDYEKNNRPTNPNKKICEAVRNGGEVVWANTAVQEGLLGRSDLPLRTAVGAPVCSLGPDLCVLVLFSPYTVAVRKTRCRWVTGSSR